jgi:peroxiredoxin
MNFFIKIFFLMAVTFQMENVMAQTSQTTDLKIDTTIKYYNRLANSKTALDKILLKHNLYKLLISNDEKDWMTAERFFLRLNLTTADSVLKAEKIKFPTGVVIRDEQAKAIYAETDAVKKEALYKVWIKKFPPEKFATDMYQYDYVRGAVSIAYAKANNLEKALQYANMFEVPFYKGIGWAATADELLKNGHLSEAYQLFKQARDYSFKYMTTNRNDEYADYIALNFVRYSNSLAEILFKQKKYIEALRYAKQARDSSQNEIGNQNPYYVKTLMALGKNKEAFDEIDAAVKKGRATAEMKEALQTLYVKVKGSKVGYDQYIASITKMLADKKKAEIAKQMINLPAPDFTLKDVDGNTVSLASLKGKIVIVDFWAIWCGPCKASLPSMRLAVNKYKNDPDVKFLFIHTMENYHRNAKIDENPTMTAKKYIEDNHYPFQVLMDLKDPVTGKNNVVSSYKVTGIPTKFVIDKNGNIRFRFTGLTNGDDAAFEEVSAMIDLAKNAN